MVKKAYANAGDDATIVFPDYGTKIKHQRCVINRFEIWARGRHPSKRIFASKFGSGTNAVCVGDCNIYNNRGSISVVSKNVEFTLANTTKADQKRYCIKIRCSGSDDINNDCENDEISLVIVGK